MPVRRDRAGLRASARAQLAALPCLVAIALVGTATGALSARAGSRLPQPAPKPVLELELVGPSRAPVGRVVSYRLVVRNAPDIGAFAANLRFDDGALGVVRVRAPRTLPGAGALTALSAVETPHRKVLAGWTCAGPGCDASATATGPGG